MQLDSKAQLIIAAKQFLYRLGIKTMINVIGIEPQLIEVDSFDDVKSHLHENARDVFLIISEDVFPCFEKACCDEIVKVCPRCKTLFICENTPKDFNPRHCILNANNQIEILDKFQEFFFKQEEAEGQSRLEKTFLSERETDVLKAVALGYSNKEIADKLFISINTVITHRKNITEKLDIKSIAGLTVYAIMNNLIKPEDVNI